MTDPARTAAPDTGQAIRLLGVETEYGFAALGADGGRLDPARSTDALMREMRALVPHLPCSGRCDVFTANGSRIYIDCGLHPEVATPECSTPAEAVVFTRAGDHLLARAARAVERTWPERGIEAVLWKANVDHRTGATWGSHESYLHQSPQPVLARHLMSHLVTRLIYTGAGGFSNRTSELRFVVSPRALHLENEISNNSTRQRGIFHTRDEPLADGPYRRLHVLAGESLWSETADYLRMGTTALLVAQIDAHRRLQADLCLVSPLDALALIANDVGCQTPLPMSGGEHLTAIEIQLRLLESVEADLGASHLPAWAAAVCKRWRFVLERLQASPASLVGVLDWPTKLAVLRRQCEGQGVEWTFCSDSRSEQAQRAPEIELPSNREAPFSTRLLETDMRFNRLDDRGIFAALDAQDTLSHRIVTPEAIQQAVREPPATGRARIRAACIERLAGQAEAVSCTWQEITDHARGQRLVLGDPFQSEGEEWSALPEQQPRSTPRLDASIRPIREALRAGAPREALQRMHALLMDPEPIPHALCHYCVQVFDSLVPTVPVPVLRRGAATAGPVLEALFEHLTHESQPMLENRAGTLLYRFHEARHAYERARQIIARLLSRATEHGDLAEVALLSNNLGYEHLLAGDGARAEPYFERALGLFEQGSQHDELPSVRANLLHSRFEQLAPDRWMALAPELKRVNRALCARRDWRARKSLMLLARLAHSRGHRAAAIARTQQALDAAYDIPTQLRKWDGAFLEMLQ